MFLELVRGSAAGQNLKSRVTSSYVSRSLGSSHFIKASAGVFIGTRNCIWLAMANLDSSATCVGRSGSTGSALAGRHILTAHHQRAADPPLADGVASHFSLKAISVKRVHQTDPTHLLKHLAARPH